MFVVDQFVHNTREPAHLQVMAAIPTDSVYESVDDMQLPNWQKGEEILQGAHLAVKEINDLPNLLSGYRFEGILVRVPQCELSEE